jgi:hypothetical protein
VKLPVWLSSILVSAFLASQGWLVLAVIDLKDDMAAVKATLTVEKTTIANKQ